MVAAASTALIAGYGIYHHLTEFRKIFTSNFQLSTRIEERNIQLRMEGAQEHLLFLLNTGAVRELATSPESHPGPAALPEKWRERLQTVFSGIHRVTRCCTRIRLVDREGTEIVRVDWDGNQPRAIEPSPGTNHSRTSWFQQSLISAPEQIRIVLDTLVAENEDMQHAIPPLVQMTVPVFHITGRIVGILVMDFLWENLFQNEGHPAFHPRAEWFLVDSRGGFFYYRPQEIDPFTQADIEFLVRKQFPGITALSPLQDRETLIQGSRYHACITPVRFPNNRSPLFLLGQAVPASLVDSSIREYLTYFSGILILSLLISLAASYLLARQITRPIDRLRESANQIAKGQLHHRIEIQGGPELTDLARDFNLMAQRLTQEMLWEKQYALAIVNSIGDGVYSIDSNQIIRSWNAGAQRITGHSAKEIIGKPCFEILRHEDQSGRILCQSSECPMAHALTHRQTCTVPQAYIRRNNGDLIPISLTASPLVSAEGRIMGAVEVFRDITQELELLETIRAADLAKSNFLSGMSHELITPLHAIIGFADVLAEQAAGSLNPTQMQYVEDIRESGKHLSRLLDEILELAKIKAGAIKLVLTRFPVVPLMENCLTVIREPAARKNLEVQTEIPEECRQLTVFADERKLRRTVENLLNNAVQFTPEKGRIILRLRIVRSCRLWDNDIPIGSNESALDIVPKLEIMVEDTGIGIAPENQAKIFQSFFQIQNGLQDKTPGAGLGLPLTRRFMELHRGGVRVESEGTGKGSRFIVRLPIIRDSEETDGS